MSTISAPVTMTPAVVPLEGPGDSDGPPSSRIYRISTDLYLKMVEAGLFRKKDRVYLWRGQLVEKMTKHPPHSVAQMALLTALIRLVPAEFHVRPESPVLLLDDSVPEPDLTVVRGDIQDYSERHPSPAEVALLVEVADSSLAGNRGEKAEEYARSAISAYWIVNIPDRCVEVYTEPTGPDPAPIYRAGRRYGPAEEVPVVLDGREVGRIAVATILPRA